MTVRKDGDNICAKINHGLVFIERARVEEHEAGVETTIDDCWLVRMRDPVVYVGGGQWLSCGDDPNPKRKVANVDELWG